MAKTTFSVAPINGTFLVFIYVTMPVANEQAQRRSRLMTGLHIIRSNEWYYHCGIFSDCFMRRTWYLYKTYFIFHSKMNHKRHARKLEVCRNGDTNFAYHCPIYSLLVRLFEGLTILVETDRVQIPEIGISETDSPFCLLLYLYICWKNVLKYSSNISFHNPCTLLHSC